MSYDIQAQNTHHLQVSDIANGSTLNHLEATALAGNSPQHSLHVQKLQERMNQLEKAIIGLGKKESYVAAMAVDLEHIMMILLKRLDKETVQLAS